MTLPTGLTARPLARSDSLAMVDLIAAQELADSGMAEIEEADLLSDWSTPGHDLATSSVGVFDGEELVAYAEHIGGDKMDTAVHPSHRGRGIGTWLESWLRALATERGESVIGMPVPEGSAGDRLLESLGYEVRWTSWILELPEDTAVPERRLPDGYAVGEARPEQYAELQGVLEDAFLEWAVRKRESFEDFTATVLGRPGFEPWNLRVVTDPAGAVAAAAVAHLSGDGTAYVARLATRRDQRNRGLAQEQLVDAFAAGRQAGATRFELSTDSRTGALGLYEKVGMRPRSVWLNRGIRLVTDFRRTEPVHR